MSTGYVLALDLLQLITKKYGLDDQRPDFMYHYTSVESGLLILKHQSIKLSHCEYLNDSDEISKSVRLIFKEIEEFNDRYKGLLRASNFSNEVVGLFNNRSSSYEAFVFCMSEGNQNLLIGKQDILSLWRAYGRDGKGLCLTFLSRSFAYQDPYSACRISRVIYDEKKQKTLIADMLENGYRYYSTPSMTNDAVTATVVALMFILPIMKNSSFEEEKEWRFIYVPDSSHPKFSDRHHACNFSGLIIPHYFYDQNDGLNLEVSEIMVGPSAHKDLNARALEFMRGNAVVGKSMITYRGF